MIINEPRYATKSVQLVYALEGNKVTV